MHVMMTEEQFKVLKDKTKGGKIILKEDDDVHGTLKTDDVIVEYYYNSQEGRLYLGVAKRITLAAYCASDNIICTFIMDLLSEIPNPKAETTEGSPKPNGGGGSEGEEKKAA